MKEKYEFSQRSQRLRCEDNINGIFSSNNHMKNTIKLEDDFILCTFIIN